MFVSKVTGQVKRCPSKVRLFLTWENSTCCVTPHTTIDFIHTCNSCTFAVYVDVRLFPYRGHEEPLNPRQISVPGVSQELLLWIQLLHCPLQRKRRWRKQKDAFYFCESTVIKQKKCFQKDTCTESEKKPIKEVSAYYWTVWVKWQETWWVCRFISGSTWKVRITKSSRIHPLKNMNPCSKCQGISLEYIQTDHP